MVSSFKVHGARLQTASSPSCDTICTGMIAPSTIGRHHAGQSAVSRRRTVGNRAESAPGPAAVDGAGGRADGTTCTDGHPIRGLKIHRDSVGILRKMPSRSPPCVSTDGGMPQLSHDTNRNHPSVRFSSCNTQQREGDTTSRHIRWGRGSEETNRRGRSVWLNSTHTL